MSKSMAKQQSVEKNGAARPSLAKMKEVKELISRGKERGYLTFEELNEVLPPEMVESEQLDAVLSHFDELKIEIVENDEEGKKLMQRASPRSQEDDEEKIKVRLREYREFTEPAINFFKSQGRVVTIDGSPAPGNIHVEIMKKLEEKNDF